MHRMEPRMGIYVHIPFCASKCGYCDFYSRAGCESDMPRYQQALIAHIRECVPRIAPAYIDTVYFGGGTPSYYGARRIAQVLDEIKSSGLLMRNAEITVEANPDSLTRGEARILRRAGVNRLSIGMQSANNDILKMIGRRHNFKQVEMAVRHARMEGFDNVSLDLIYGLPSQSAGDWAESLARALELHPEHLSCYGLKLEPGTPMYELKDSPLIPDDDLQADMYLAAIETLARYNYHQYEISNFCIPGYESRHNFKYWRLEDYLGFGPGAHSCVGRVRYSYVRDLDAYIQGVLQSGDMIDEYEEIGDFERGSEYLMLGMRTMWGITKEEYQHFYHNSFDELQRTLEEFRDSGWATEENGRWHFTPEGFLLSNQLIGKLLEAQTARRAEQTPWIKPEVERQPRQTLPEKRKTIEELMQKEQG